MLSQENELLTRIGAGTPMGGMLREYWVPALRSAKLEVDGKPERVRMFGENFVAFRATDGQVGFIDEACPHRRASLALGRNEEGGIRCIFHGWKFNVNGKCVDAPTEPDDKKAAFEARVPMRAFPVHESGGLIWVYLGAKKEPPPFPEFEFTGLPASHVRPLRGIIHTNWLQGLEALLDSAHVGYLHASNLGSAAGRDHFKSESDYMLDYGAPSFEFDEQPYGFREGALRHLKDGNVYARIREVALPFFSFIPQTPGTQSLVCCSIPIDDEWTAQWYIAYNPEKPISAERMRAYGTDSGDPDYFNSDMGNSSNMWNQDREAMKNGHWSGIVGRGNAYEDFVVQESMGPIVDRDKEFLGSPDIVIVRARRYLLNAIRKFQETGEVSFTGPDVAFEKIRAISCDFNKDQNWRNVDPFTLQQLAAE
jgi:phthalate 4,5-dioxygenase oxygenase subunit